MMSSTSTTARLSALKSKATIIEFKPKELPEPSADILELFRLNTAAGTDSSNHWTIDVFPNMTPIMMYTMLNSIRHANDTQSREHSKSSVATICMYHMSMVYGYFLINDLYVRSAPSAHARSWRESSWRNDFVDFLMNLPLPEFLAPILSQFHAFETDNTRNVSFVPSAAGFDHNQFFGRVYPLNFFAAIHDCTAMLPGNSSKNAVLADLYSRVLYTIQDPEFVCVTPDLIGVSLHRNANNTANTMNSKLFQIYNSVINPVLFRDFQRRSSLAALFFSSPVYPTAHVNAYDYMFSATSANIRELKVVLQAVRAVLDHDVPCKVTLGQFIVNNSSKAIIKHGYSTFALPTWTHGDNDNKAETYAQVTNYIAVTEAQRAEDFSFLQRPTAEIQHGTRVYDVIYAEIAQPAVPVPLPAEHQITRFLPFNLGHATERPRGFPRHDRNILIQFSDELNTAPTVLVLDTDGDLTVSAHLPLLAGKIIESFELDGSTIEMPSADKSLGMQNCMFADSAIPYKYVRPGSDYRPRAIGTVLPPLIRAKPNSTPRLPASTLLHDRTKIMLPRANFTIREAPVPNTLPGMTIIDPVNVLRYSQSFMGFNTVPSSDNAAAIDTVPAMQENLLMVWSPYTYTPYETDDYPEPNFSNSRHYYLTNLRTIFGTDYNLIKAKHPYESMPVI